MRRACFPLEEEDECLRVSEGGHVHGSSYPTDSVFPGFEKGALMALSSQEGEGLRPGAKLLLGLQGGSCASFRAARLLQGPQRPWLPGLTLVASLEDAGIDAATPACQGKAG